MVASMTGFSRKSFSVEDNLYTVEIRTLNHKTLDIHCRLPEGLTALEVPVRTLVKKYIGRGRVDLRITMDYGSGSEAIELNKPVYRTYCQLVAEIAQEHKTDAIDPIAMLALPNIISSVNPDPEVVAESFLPPLEDVLIQLKADREREGSHLWDDILERLKQIETLVAELQGLAARQQEEVGERFKQRLAQLETNIDENRLMTELAILVDKSDINEELVRLQAHQKEFVNTGNKSNPVGRRLEFLGQEMLREINTVAAKSSIYEVSKTAVDIKTELEKIREQIQNIE